MSVIVDIQYAVDTPLLPDETSMMSWALSAFTPEDVGEMTIRIVDMDEMRRLNNDYRNVDKPTNVLAFPADWESENSVRYIGDIAICANVVESEAHEQNKSISAHWAHMVIHGVLHLIGYDHIEPRDAVLMEAKEAELLAAFNFADPYKIDPNHSNSEGKTTSNERRAG